MARYGGQGSNPAGRNRYSTLGSKSASQQRADTRRQGATEKRETAYSPAPVAQVTSSSSPSDWLGQNNAIVDRPRISPSTVVGRTYDPPARPGDIGGVPGGGTPERSPEQYQMDRQNERDAEAQRADTRRQQAQTARQKAREGKRDKAEPVNTKLTASIKNVRKITEPNTRPPRNRYQTLKPAEGQLSSTARLENDQFKYSLPSRTPLVELTGRDKTVSIFNEGNILIYPEMENVTDPFSVTNRPAVLAHGDYDLYDPMEAGKEKAIKKGYQGKVLSPDRLAEVADRYGKELTEWYDDAQSYGKAAGIIRATRSANQKLVHSEAAKAGDTFADWQSEEDRQRQTGELDSNVTYDMILTARDNFLARSDITDAAKHIIRTTPIVATSGFGTMRASGHAIEYDPMIKRSSYQDIDRIAAIFGHESVHVLDDVMGDTTYRQPGGYRGKQWVSDVRASTGGGGGQTEFQRLVAEITQPALSKYTGRGDDMPEALYDPTDVKAHREHGGRHYPYHQYTHFGEQKAWAIPPELQGQYDYFKEDAFKLPAGNRWEMYTAKDGFRKWRVVEKSGSEPSNVQKQTIMFTGTKGQASTDPIRDIRDLLKGEARYQ